MVSTADLWVSSGEERVVTLRRSVVWDLTGDDCEIQTKMFIHRLWAARCHWVASSYTALGGSGESNLAAQRFWMESSGGQSAYGRSF